LSQHVACGAHKSFHTGAYACDCRPRELLLACSTSLQLTAVRRRHFDPCPSSQMPCNVCIHVDVIMELHVEPPSRFSSRASYHIGQTMRAAVALMSFCLHAYTPCIRSGSGGGAKSGVGDAGGAGYPGTSARTRPNARAAVHRWRQPTQPTGVPSACWGRCGDDDIMV
jgi:hypothetical protein